jgi:hypothetical protein
MKHVLILRAKLYVTVCILQHKYSAVLEVTDDDAMMTEMSVNWTATDDVTCQGRVKLVRRPKAKRSSPLLHNSYAFSDTVYCNLQPIISLFAVVCESITRLPLPFNVGLDGFPAC